MPFFPTQGAPTSYPTLTAAFIVNTHLRTAPDQRRSVNTNLKHVFVTLFIKSTMILL